MPDRREGREATSEGRRRGAWEDVRHTQGQAQICAMGRAHQVDDNLPGLMLFEVVAKLRQVWRNVLAPEQKVREGADGRGGLLVPRRWQRQKSPERVAQRRGAGLERLGLLDDSERGTLEKEHERFVGRTMAPQRHEVELEGLAWGAGWTKSWPCRGSRRGRGHFRSPREPRAGGAQRPRGEHPKTKRSLPSSSSSSWRQP